MAITSVNSITSAIAAGQYHKQSWNKTLAATTTVGKWYSTFTLPGQPVAGVYGGVVLTNGSGNWTAAQTGGVTTIDTIVAHGLFIGETFQTNASWSTNTWMQSLTNKTVTAVPNPHQFQFLMAGEHPTPTVEAGTSANITPYTNQATPMIGNTSTATVNYGGAHNPGRINCGENVSALIKHLVNLEMTAPTAASCPSQLLLVDMLLNYPNISINLNTAQTMVGNNGSSTLPRYANGNGVMAFLELSAANGATAQTVSINYCNSSGLAGQTTPGTVAMTASSAATHIPYTGVAVNNFGPFLPLAAGDQGIQYVTSLTFSATNGATFATLVLCKPLVSIPLVTVNTTTAKDLIFDILTMPRIYDGACLNFLYYAGVGVATPAVYGTLDFVWG